MTPAPTLLPFPGVRGAARGMGPARMPTETLLGVLPGATADRRVCVVRRTGICGAESVQLRTETFSPAVGWFPQSAVDLPADQLAALRGLLGTAAATVPPSAPRRSAGDATVPATLPFRLAG